MTAIADPETYDRLKSYFASIREPMPSHYIKASARKPPAKLATVREAPPEAPRQKRLGSRAVKRLIYPQVFRAW